MKILCNFLVPNDQMMGNSLFPIPSAPSLISSIYGGVCTSENDGDKAYSAYQRGGAAHENVKLEE